MHNPKPEAYRTRVRVRQKSELHAVLYQLNRFQMADEEEASVNNNTANPAAIVEAAQLSAGIRISAETLDRTNPSTQFSTQDTQGSSSATSADREAAQPYTITSAIAPGDRRNPSTSCSAPHHEPVTSSSATSAGGSFNAFASSTDTSTTQDTLGHQNQGASSTSMASGILLEQQGASKRLKTTEYAGYPQELRQQAALKTDSAPPSLFVSSSTSEVSSGPASAASFTGYPNQAIAAAPASSAADDTGLLLQQLYSAQQHRPEAAQSSSAPTASPPTPTLPTAWLLSSSPSTIQQQDIYRLLQQANAMRAGGDIGGSNIQHQGQGLSFVEQYRQQLDDLANCRARLQCILDLQLLQMRDDTQQQSLGMGGMGFCISEQLAPLSRLGPGAGAGVDHRPPTIPNIFGYPPSLQHCQHEIEDVMLRQDMISSQHAAIPDIAHSRSQLLASMRYMQGETDLNLLGVPISAPSPAAAANLAATHELMEATEEEMEKQTFKRADGMHCLASGVPHYKSRPVIPLAAPDDRNWLSDYLSFVRAECVEVFLATYRDVQSRNTSKKVGEDQVGIRCRFCAHLHHRDRAGRSSSFPSSISRIYQSLTMMLRDHFANCTEMPPKTREKFFALKALTSQGASDSKRYWVKSAGQIGLIDTDYGIHMKDKDAVLLNAKLQFEQQQQQQEQMKGSANLLLMADHAAQEEEEEQTEQAQKPRNEGQDGGELKK